MSWSLDIQAEAEADLTNAYRWYEARRDGLGKEFMDEVGRVFARVKRRPMGRPPQYRDTRRVFLKRFPYFVMYLVRDDIVLVLAVLHQRQHQRLARARARVGSKIVRRSKAS